MTNPNQPLTLERLAALDKAAPKGPWESTESPTFGGDRPFVVWIRDPNAHPVAVVQTVGWDKKSGKAIPAFITASKGAAPALLAALRGLVVKWGADKCYGDETDEGVTAMRGCAADIESLITTHDLRRKP